jgi:hypothetical protein
MKRVVLVMLLGACGGGSGDASVDAGNPDGGGLPTTCDQACQTMALTVTIGVTARTFERAYFGVTTSRATPASLRIEAYRGGAAGCPTASSPTPDYTFLANGFVPPASTDASFTFFDFAGDVLTSGPPLVSADSGTITAVAADVCYDCIGNPPPSQPDGFIAADVDVQFPGGTGLGHLYATHCDSLDLAE